MLGRSKRAQLPTEHLYVSIDVSRRMTGPSESRTVAFAAAQRHSGQRTFAARSWPAAHATSMHTGIGH